MKKRYLCVFIVVILSLFTTFFSGCASKDKSSSQIFLEQIADADYEYDEQSNSTKITFEISVSNNTIYDMTSFIMYFNLYDGDKFLQEQMVNCDIKVGQNNFMHSIIYFEQPNAKVSKIEFVDWEANYKGVFGTYIFWFIGTIVVVAIMLLIGFGIIDIEIAYSFYVFAPVFLIIFISQIITGNWVPLIIMGIGLAVILVLDWLVNKDDAFFCD